MFYLIVRDKSWIFLASEMEFFLAVVNDIKFVTIARDSSFLGVQDPAHIIIFAICYCYYLQW